MFKHLCLRLRENQHPDTEEDETGDGEVEEPQAKRPRFELDESTSEALWDLPEGMKDYVNKYLANHVQEKDVKDKITDIHPVPKNLKKVPELVSFIRVFFMIITNITR